MTFLKILKKPFNHYFPAREEGNREGVSTFSGVYLPSVLQMLGVILFMRLGWITGHVGLAKMLIMIFMSSSILFLTSLSMTSIVTNMKVGSGGSYYIISRSLGMAFGSAIGILLTLAQLITIAVCVSGFAISLQEVLPNYSLTLLEFLTLACLGLIALFPVDFALKTQGVIFLIVLSAILSVFFGSSSTIPPLEVKASSVETLSFWGAFALFFPATTGIESGMAMSGDLKTPSRSLAIGTIGAVLTAFIIYALLSLFLVIIVPLPLLRLHPMIIYHVSKFSFLFILGVWGATLSSALGSLISSPRTLQSLAKDRIFPSFFSKNPKRAGALILLIATAMTLLTDMNHLLPILSMVCLMTYGLLNYVAFFETFLKNPSWRPLFKTPLAFSLAGTLACMISMFMINAGWAFLVLFASAGLCFWTTKRKLKGGWDDIRYSLFSFLASTAMSKLLQLKKNPRSWRPNILAIINPDLKDQGIIDLAHDLNQSKGFLTFGATLPKDANLSHAEKAFAEFFTQRDIPCFFHINSHSLSHVGTHNIVQNYGLGPLQPNTIILKPPQSELKAFCDLLEASYELQKNILIYKNEAPQKRGAIDLWWGGRYHSNFELSLALSHLLQSGRDWEKATMTIKTLVKNQAAKAHMTALFEKYYAVLRFENLKFKAYIDESTDFYDHIADYSTDADLTFLGLKAPDGNPYTHYYKHLMKQTERIPNVAYVLAGENLNFQGIFE